MSLLEVEAFQRITKINLHRWEIDTLVTLDDTFISTYFKGGKEE